jgi:hypothetical protein
MGPATDETPANLRSAAVIYTALYSYLLGWVVTSIGLALAVRKLQDSDQPLPSLILLAVAAGIAWPLVVLGTAQMTAVALVAEVSRGWNDRSIRKRARAFAENELDDLLDEWLNNPSAGAGARCR